MPNSPFANEQDRWKSTLKASSQSKGNIAKSSQSPEDVLGTAMRNLADKINNSRMGKAIQPYLPLSKYIFKKK